MASSPSDHLSSLAVHDTGADDREENKMTVEHPQVDPFLASFVAISPIPSKAEQQSIGKVLVISETCKTTYWGSLLSTHLPSDKRLESTVDPGYIISLIRGLLPPRDCGSGGLPGRDEPSAAEEGGDPWEDGGCVLWDLAASKCHAEFMVKNLVLEVLSSILPVSKSVRVTEICLGIIANLACHGSLNDAVASTNGLVDAIVDQLFLDDSACLTEVCWILSLGLQSSASNSWVGALQHEHIAERVIWILGNTLNYQLLEKSLELLLAIIESQDGGPVLLPLLIKLGLENHFVRLLTSELSKIQEERSFDGECLSLHLKSAFRRCQTAPYSQVISSNEELIQLVCSVVKLRDKVEVATSSIMAIVIVANVLPDDPNLTCELSLDLLFLHGLLDTFPLIDDDFQARNALWSVLEKLLVHVQGSDMGSSILQQYALALLEKLDLIMADLDNHPLEDSIEDKPQHASNTSASSLRRVVSLFDWWISERLGLIKDVVKDDGIDVGKVNRFMQYCQKFIG
ncbi:hypothetical protein QJS10_CPA02g00918 [Acorus calamus]|uniref:ARM repeat superfamily protein n=1 Tax=Acorus calamus TaxID=4465 RepID=A0AAV9FER6_ACOCL|nr:hypothetical protein QJS10_CPA02g00918 [Acorus calamus]